MKLSEQQVFTTQLVTLLDAGVSLVPALKMIRDPQRTHAPKKHWLNPLIDGLHQGQSFSVCLRNSQEGFDAFYCGLVEIGEHSGQLSQMLLKISQDLKKTEAIKSQLKKAMTYPLCVLLLSIFLLVGMLIWVIPSFEQVFAGFNAQLPPLTAFLLDLSRWVRQYFYLGILCIASFITLLLVCWSRLIRFQKAVDQLFLRIPLAGMLLHHALMARWNMTIYILQTSGTPLLQAIRISARCSDHWFLHDTSTQIYRQLLQGQSLHTAASMSDQHQLLFKHETLQLLAVGEESGSLVQMMLYLANFHERRLTEQLDVLMEMIEPLMVVIMGLMVGGMVIALYLPLFKLGEMA